MDICARNSGNGGDELFEWDNDMISKSLSDVYTGLKYRFTEGRRAEEADGTDKGV